MGLFGRFLWFYFFCFDNRLFICENMEKRWGFRPDLLAVCLAMMRFVSLSGQSSSLLGGVPPKRA